MKLLKLHLCRGYRKVTNKCEVDWQFIRKLEGWVPKGYVPKDLDGDNSGVTVAAGFDIGQHSKAQIKAFKFAKNLEAKLLPYAGIKGQAARDLLKAIPLLPSIAELEEIDKTIKKHYYTKVEREYNDNSDITFSFLDTEKQTVIISVAFQYGSLKKVPRFFKFVSRGMWKCAVAELEEFGDAYSKRRKQEAALLRSSIKEEGKFTKC